MEKNKTKKKYSDLTDLEKLTKQWHKLTGLHNREEWSAAILRSATAAEIAANFAIRREFIDYNLNNQSFANHLLIWANGLIGKIDHILIPINQDDAAKRDVFVELKNTAKEIHSKRNAIIHQGEFCNATEAKSIILLAQEFINIIVHLYEPSFKLKEISYK